MKKYETINNIRVEVITDPHGEIGCSGCCFLLNQQSCNSANCFTLERDVFFKLTEDEVAPTDAPQYIQDCLEYAQDAHDYYKSVCDSVGNLLGIAAYTSDDGSIQDSVLVAKLEELVAELVLENVKLKSKVRSLEVFGN
jgi:hypothetical protein